MDLLAYWNLTERPFEATWDTRFFFGSPRHEEALNRLCFLAEEQSMNIGLLTGEIGCGKTLTRAVFARRLNPSRYQVLTEDTSAFTSRELLASLLLRLDDGNLKFGKGKAGLFLQLRRVLERMQGEGRHLVLIFDEAQELSVASLNDLKMLTNFNCDGRSYLTMILVGQPELRELIAKHPPTNQRISLRFHLGALYEVEVASYIRHRLLAAGHPSGDLFTAEAITRLYQACIGIPREINRLAKLALEFAWLRRSPRVDQESVDTIIHDLERQQLGV